MNHGVTIKTDMGMNSELVIHPEKASAIGLGSRTSATLNFGNRKLDVEIRMNHELSPENILLSSGLIRQLHMPDYPIYELYVNRDEIIIGPYIGLLMSCEDRRLTFARLNKAMVYLKKYTELHGAIVIFALDKVDKDNQLIEGYCYNPPKKCWQKGRFPYPASIYRTIGLNTEWKRHFLATIGDKLFNSRFFNKWEMHQWFSREPEINPHLPHTVLYCSPQDILEMFERFPQIYIKPVFGLRGRGIYRMSSENTRWILKCRENGINHTITFEDWERAGEYIRNRFRPRRYLIQQAIDLLEYGGGLVDFRCVAQKNQSNEWACRAIIGRAGVRDSVVSNISSGGTAFSAENILRRAIPGSEDAIGDLKFKIAALANIICNKLDEYGVNCGNLGLDIGLDRQGRLWLIEINNRDPDPRIALDIHDVQLYYSLKTGPLFYAKYLAGFGKSR